jgi:hypothetical protein
MKAPLVQIMEFVRLQASRVFKNERRYSRC